MKPRLLMTYDKHIPGIYQWKLEILHDTTLNVYEMSRDSDRPPAAACARLGRRDVEEFSCWCSRGTDGCARRIRAADRWLRAPHPWLRALHPCGGPARRRAQQTPRMRVDSLGRRNVEEAPRTRDQFDTLRTASSEQFLQRLRVNEHLRDNSISIFMRVLKRKAIHLLNF